jgi:hypothetical protein
MARRFLVARNPEAGSTLPYLLYVPVGAGLALKARDSWPRTSRVYCHRLESWPDDVEVIEDVTVVECHRRGVAVDLVLDRKRESRSQFVFTRLPGGREGIFWQTRKVASTARPGARIPGRRISDLTGSMTILVDTRERYPYRFVKQQAMVTREALPAGDYAVRDASGRLLAAVERKTIGDLASSLNGGTLTFELAKLASLSHAALVVEDRYASLLKVAHAPTGFLPDLLARVQVRYPEIPIVFTETRPLAEEWTFRWLGAVLAESLSTSDAWGDDDGATDSGTAEDRRPAEDGDADDPGARDRVRSGRAR